MATTARHRQYYVDDWDLHRGGDLMLKIEAGKRYITRDGDETGPAELARDGKHFWVRIRAHRVVVNRLGFDTLGCEFLIEEAPDAGTDGAV